MDFHNKSKEELIALLEEHQGGEVRARTFEDVTREAILLSFDDIIIDANAAAHKVLGYEVGQLIGLSVYACINEQHLFESLTWRDANTKRVFVKKDGSHITVYLRTLLTEYQGRFVQTYSFVLSDDFCLVDRRFKDIYDISPNAVIQVDPRGKLLAINPAGVKLFGYQNQEEAVAAEIYTGSYLFSPKEGLAYLKRLRKEISIPYHLFKVLNPRTKKEHWIEVNSTGFYGTRGQLIHYEAIIRDVTTSKVMEFHLQNEKSRLKAVLNSIPGPVLVMRPMDLVIVDCNEKAKDIFGDIEGQECSNLGPFAKTGFGASSRSTVISGENLSTVTSWQCTDTDRHGTTWEVYDVPFHDLDGSPLSLKFMLDISKRVGYEEKLKEARALAEQGNQAKSTFLANMSHEIRNPLNGVLGTLQLLLDDTLSAEQRSYVKGAMECGASLLNIINSILNISRVDAGMMDVQHVEMNPAVLFSSTTTLCIPQAHKKGLSLEFKRGSSLPHFLKGDSERIRQILFNLIGNAIKFTDSGGITVSASLLPYTKRDGSRTLYFSVSDSGVGIPPLLINQAFDVFSQVDSSYTRRHQGAGLGLGIVKRLVYLLGGTIAVDSDNGKGTTVHVTVAVLDTKSEPVVEETLKNNAPVVNFENIHVLLAEDEVINRTIAVTLLERLGCHVISAENGFQALEKLRENTFDLIFMDIQMPGCSGIDFTRKVRNDEEFRDISAIPIIAMTAHSMEGDKEVFLKAGMSDYIAKPFAIEEIKRVLCALPSC